MSIVDEIGWIGNDDDNYLRWFLPYFSYLQRTRTFMNFYFCCISFVAEAGFGGEIIDIDDYRKKKYKIWCQANELAASLFVVVRVLDLVMDSNARNIIERNWIDTDFDSMKQLVTAVFYLAPILRWISTHRWKWPECRLVHMPHLHGARAAQVDRISRRRENEKKKNQQKTWSQFTEVFGSYANTSKRWMEKCHIT